MKFTCRRSKPIIIALIFTILVFSGKALGRRAIPDDNLAYPVLIITKRGSGSGFFYRHDNKYYLVTARHVLFKPASVEMLNLPKNLKLPQNLKRKLSYNEKLKRLSFFGTMTQNERDEIISLIPNNKSFIDSIRHLYNASQKLKLRYKNAELVSYSSDPNETAAFELHVDFESLNQSHSILYSKYSDIAAVQLGIVVNNGDSNYKIQWDGKAIGIKRIIKSKLIGVNEQMVKKFNDVLVGNEVYIFGYPTSLSISPEIDIKRPLLRKGIVAGKNYILKTIILDCPVFFGNSGGLVLEAEQIAVTRRQYRVIGIITKFVPFLGVWKENSGYSVAEPMDGLIDLLSN